MWKYAKELPYKYGSRKCVNSLIRLKRVFFICKQSFKKENAYYTHW